MFQHTTNLKKFCSQHLYAHHLNAIASPRQAYRWGRRNWSSLKEKGEDRWRHSTSPLSTCPQKSVKASPVLAPSAGNTKRPDPLIKQAVAESVQRIPGHRTVSSIYLQKRHQVLYLYPWILLTAKNGGGFGSHLQKSNLLFYSRGKWDPRRLNVMPRVTCQEGT